VDLKYVRHFFPGLSAHEHRALLRQLIKVERAGRNNPNGYWIAEATPKAAAHGSRSAGLARRF
jgi:hypothetical protein